MRHLRYSLKCRRFCQPRTSSGQLVDTRPAHPVCTTSTVQLTCGHVPPVVSWQQAVHQMGCEKVEELLLECVQAVDIVLAGPKPDARSSAETKYDVGQHYSRIPAILFADTLVHADPLIHVNAVCPGKGPGIAGLREGDKLGGGRRRSWRRRVLTWLHSGRFEVASAAKLHRQKKYPAPPSKKFLRGSTVGKVFTRCICKW